MRLICAYKIRSGIHRTRITCVSTFYAKDGVYIIVCTKCKYKTNSVITTIDEINNIPKTAYVGPINAYKIRSGMRPHLQKYFIMFKVTSTKDLT